MFDEDKARFEMMNLLEDKPADKRYLLDAMKKIANDYQSEEFAIDIAKSIDFNHMNFINFQVAADAQYHFSFAIKSGAKTMLTDEGKHYLAISGI